MTPTYTVLEKVFIIPKSKYTVITEIGVIMWPEGDIIGLEYNWMNEENIRPITSEEEIYFS